MDLENSFENDTYCDDQEYFDNEVYEDEDYDENTQEAYDQD